jgi:hypothetical protein
MMRKIAKRFPESSCATNGLKGDDDSGSYRAAASIRVPP